MDSLIFLRVKSHSIWLKNRTVEQYCYIYNPLFNQIGVCFCIACSSGFFKPSQGDQSCQQCPINSRTTNEGATSCVCRVGYYRTDSDPAQMPCTSTLFLNDSSPIKVLRAVSNGMTHNHRSTESISKSFILHKPKHAEPCCFISGNSCPFFKKWLVDEAYSE